MNNQTAAAALLRECKRALDALLSAQPGTAEEDQQQYRQCQALLPEDLRTLLEEAKEMKWPFVPEKWQYKQDLGPEDKTNLQDMISARLPDLLVYLKASIMVKDCVTATAIVFLIDRFLYWIDASRELLQITKGLHKLQPSTPISPQVLIRRARLSVNTGKLLKAEYILSSLISDNGATGTWRYTQDSDRVLVQSVCLQIRGQILQKLGMWYEAAELIWASIVGYSKLPQPDKKGIATSLGILADIFASMSEKDYVRFKTNAQIDLSLLQEFSHRLLAAAEACKLAAAYSQYTPLFVLTAVNIRGVCLLSYSHSKDCPPEKRKFYLSEAKESFEIGLLTKNEKSPITSKQELHSFIKAAFCLTTVHRWLHGESEELREVSQLCREAMGKLHSYSTSLTAEEDKGVLAKEIMSLITSVKKSLQVESFPNSDARSYVPNSYKGTVEKPILQGAASFDKILAIHSQHHLSVCEVFEKACRIHKAMPGETQVGVCITTLRTETNSIDAVCTTEETGYQRRGAVKTLKSSPAGSTSEKLSGQRNKYIGPDVMKTSFDEEIEPLEIEINDVNPGFSRWQNRSQTTTSESSWCKLSKSSYSSSWEELNCNSSKEAPGDGQQQEKGSREEQCCTTESAYSCLLTPQALHPSPWEPLGSCWESPQPSSEIDTPLVEKTSCCGEELWEGRHSGKSCSGEKSGEGNNMVPFPSTPYSVPSRPEEEKEEEKMKASSGCRTKDSGREGGGGAFVWVHPEGGTADSTEDTPSEAHPPINGGTSVVSTGMEEKMASDSSGSDWLRKSAVVGNRALQVHEVDAQAETVDDTEFDFVSVGDFVNIHPTTSVPKHQSTHSAPRALPSGRKISLTKHFDCATTEEDEEKPQDMLSSRRQQSSSSLSSWCKSAQMPKRSPEGSVLSTRGSGFVFVPGRTKEEILDARFLRDDDYMQLLAGVEHNWLVQRLMPTGIFKSKQLRKAYSALLLKYSKKSGLWTGQETAVFIGDYLNVAKEGKQRNAFWIHFLHQEESLGRYVGKEYKEEKGLLHHFSDVERQMTAQYYVTEFNKRLYEQKVPTQIFYIPSAVLLILEDRTIKGCVSVEPYILGEFVKLSNNTKVVKNEYKATEYGLAYGHFCYEFSNGTDVVVDLQGWVTGNGKGLIYLTDPQIHSLNSKDVSHSNFGKRGIYYFFHNQHVQCNEICRCLSLTRPSVELTQDSHTKNVP
ncbi:alpha-protein kinase 1 [Dryobates pubescens]|uniref:alpha-protein kinase 1 n=1 Tax=Dryobates pubescens TaxID=118200 RepID=UPI0023B96898|nr:alpha-protein kinase 1 [Dryobates pubescens]